MDFFEAPVYFEGAAPEPDPIAFVGGTFSANGGAASQIAPGAVGDLGIWLAANFDNTALSWQSPPAGFTKDYDDFTNNHRSLAGAGLLTAANQSRAPNITTAHLHALAFSGASDVTVNEWSAIGGSTQFVTPAVTVTVEGSRLLAAALFSQTITGTTFTDPAGMVEVSGSTRGGFPGRRMWLSAELPAGTFASRTFQWSSSWNGSFWYGLIIP